jgi:predicted nucleic-acid-binding Zn-ribbon protein
MVPMNYKCPKCLNNNYEIGEIRTAGGFWSKIFDVQGQKFTAVTCAKCRYTEFFKADSSRLENIFDLFTN